MSLLLLLGGSTPSVIPVDPETTPLGVVYELDNRTFPQLEATTQYVLDNRREYQP